MSACGVASACTCSSMPRSRKISIARWLVMCARGVFAVHRYFVIMMLGMPRLERNSAAEAPAGPEPTTTTSVEVVDPDGGCVASRPSSNSAISFPFRRGRRSAAPHPGAVCGRQGAGTQGCGADRAETRGPAGDGAPRAVVTDHLRPGVPKRYALVLDGEPPYRGTPTTEKDGRMSGWTSEDLDTFGAAEEVLVAPADDGGRGGRCRSGWSGSATTSTCAPSRAGPAAGTSTWRAATRAGSGSARSSGPWSPTSPALP